MIIIFSIFLFLLLHRTLYIYVSSSSSWVIRYTLWSEGHSRQSPLRSGKFQNHQTHDFKTSSFHLCLVLFCVVACEQLPIPIPLIVYSVLFIFPEKTSGNVNHEDYTTWREWRMKGCSSWFLFKPTGEKLPGRLRKIRFVFSDGKMILSPSRWWKKTTKKSMLITENYRFSFY